MIRDYRGKCVETGKWITGYLVKDGCNSIIVTAVGQDYSLGGGMILRATMVETDSVGQYTGFKDIGGIKIYEGDMVKSESEIVDGKSGIGKVKFIEGGYYIDTGSTLISLFETSLLSRLNETTTQAFEEAEAIKNGAKKGKIYKNASDMFADLGI